MSLFDQGGVPNDPVYHPDVAKFLADVRKTPTHLLREATHGTVTTKCGIVQQGMNFVTGWGSEVTCPNCLPK